MRLTADKETIIRNFSKCAYIYDAYANIQKRIGVELLSQIKGNNFENILEIGCGTGNYTSLLRERFKDSRISVLDISSKMVEVAQSKLQDSKIEFLIADAENIDLGEKFDLITSNASFQWFQNLDSTLLKFKRQLKEGGVILFSIFGPRTFCELNDSLALALGNVSVNASGFMVKGEISRILEKYFKEIVVKESSYEESFPGVKDLLKKIKFSGIRGDGLSGKVFFTPGLLKRLENLYLNKFKQIKATYQVFLCEGMAG